MAVVCIGWRFGIVVSVLVSINEVNLRRARLVLRWVTVSGVESPLLENLSQYITSHPGQLSLAIPPWVGVMSTSQRAVMLCGWGVKAGMVCEWVAGKTVWSPCYHVPYLSALAMGSSHNRALYKCPITLLYYFMCLSVSVQCALHWDVFDQNLAYVSCKLVQALELTIALLVARNLANATVAWEQTC